MKAEDRVVEHLKESYIGQIKSLEQQINYASNVYNYPKGHPEHIDIKAYREKLKHIKEKLKGLEKNNKKGSVNDA